MAVVMCQTVGTGIASLDLNGVPEQDHPSHKNEAMEQAATAAIRDALESSKYSSFLRQLNLYGFRRFSAGADKGSYYHPKFLRGLPWIATTIQRTKVNGRKSRKAGNPEAEPRLDDYKHLREPPRDSPYWKLHEALTGSVSSCK